VRVVFDRSKLSYAELLRFFFRLHDPTTKNRQGNDRGTQYRSVIFFTTPQQEKIAREVIAEVDKAGHWKVPLVTEVVPASKWYPAEEYHQDYLQKNPGGVYLSLCEGVLVRHLQRKGDNRHQKGGQSLNQLTMNPVRVRLNVNVPAAVEQGWKTLGVGLCGNVCRQGANPYMSFT